MSIPSIEPSESTNFNVLREIHGLNFPYQVLHPDIFVSLIRENLQHKVVCLNNKGNHIYSSKCNRRLETLSAMQACFHYVNKNSIQHQSLSVDKGTSCGDGLHSGKLQSVNGNTVVMNQQSLNKSCDNALIKVGKIESVNSLKSWFQLTCDKLADEDFLIQLIHSQENNQCIFATHIIKKIICSCSIQSDKVVTVLNYIGDKWKRTRTVTGNELDLIHAIISHQQNGEEKYIKSQVYTWFLEIISFSPDLACWMGRLSKSGNEQFQKNMSMLSIIGKVSKFCVLSSQEVPASIGNKLVNMLESHQDTFLSFAFSNPIREQFMLLKFLKVFNNVMSFYLCSGKVKSSETVVKHCEKILQSCPSMFAMCAANGFMKTMAFWGFKDSGRLVKQCSNQSSQTPNLVMARGIFLLAVKAAAVLASTDCLKDGLEDAFQAVWVCFESWMWRHFENDCVMSGWIPILLGDQDDKWIEALLCLLIIYKEYNQPSNHKERETSGSQIPKSNNTEGFWSSLCPHKLFLQFVEFICFDHVVLSDFLTSPETNFLEYFTKYLAYLGSNWNGFLSYCLKQSTFGKHNAETDHASEIKSISRFAVALSNQKERVCLDTDGVLIKRKFSDDLEISQACKLIKADGNNPRFPLVDYALSDDSSPDNDSDSELFDNHRRHFNLNIKPKTKELHYLVESADVNKYEENNVVLVGCKDDLDLTNTAYTFSEDPMTGNTSSGVPITGNTSSRDLITGNTSGRDPITGNTSSRDPITGNTSGRDPITGNTSGRDPITGNKSSRDPITGNTSSRDPITGNTSSRDLITGNTSGRDPITGNTSSRDPITGNTSGRDPITGNTSGRDPITGNTSGRDPITGNTSSRDPITGNTSSRASMKQQEKRPSFPNSATLKLPLFSSSVTSMSSDEDENVTPDDEENEIIGYEEKINRKSCVEKRNLLEIFMTMLIRLRFHIERLDKQQLFPYNAMFLLNLLNSCEEKYESM